MSFATLVIQSPLSAVGLTSVLDLAPGQLPALNNLINYMGGVAGGLQPAHLSVDVGSVKAAATLTVSAGGSANDEICTIANVVFTAKTTGATGNQFNISATAATQAASMVVAFNASADLAGIVTASALLGVITLTAVIPGVSGNAIQLSEGLANVALVAFAAGSNGTSYTIDLD